VYHSGSRAGCRKEVLDVKTCRRLSNKGVAQSKSSAVSSDWVKERRWPVGDCWSVVDDSWAGYWGLEGNWTETNGWANLSESCVSKAKTSSEGRQRRGKRRRPVGNGWCMMNDCWRGRSEGWCRKSHLTETNRWTNLGERWSRLNKRSGRSELGHGWSCLNKRGSRCWSELGHCWRRLKEGGSELGHRGGGVDHSGSRAGCRKEMLDVKTSRCLSNKGVAQSKSSAISSDWVKERRWPVGDCWSVVDDSWAGYGGLEGNWAETNGWANLSESWKEMLDVKTSRCLSDKGVSQAKSSAVSSDWVKERRWPVGDGWSVVDNSWAG
ncbi:unnamed protein product, partial [Ixodes hexagonus]